MFSSQGQPNSPDLMVIPAGKPSSEVDLVRSYLRDIGRIPLLSNDQEITYGRQVQELMSLEILENELDEKKGCKTTLEDLAKASGLTVLQLKRKLKSGRRAKERMVSANLRLVVSVAKKYTKRNMEFLDLIQEGTIGLVRGVEKFDPSRGYKFSTYAYWWIRQGITRAIAEKSRTIRLPIHVTEILNKLKKGQRELSHQISRTPNLSELAAYLDLPEEEIKDLMVSSLKPKSLEMKIGDNEDSALIDLLSGNEDLPDEKLEQDCMKMDLESLIEQLPELQGRVMRMRYGMDGDDPMSLTGIGRILGISRDRVRNLQRDGLNGLRKLSNSVEAYVAC